MEAITFGWLARWDVKYEWSYSNLDESLDYEVMVVWYSPSRILMIFKTNNHFLSVEKCCVVREIAKFLKSSSVMFIHLENWSAFSKSKLHNSTFQEIISYLIWTLVNKIIVCLVRSMFQKTNRLSFNLYFFVQIWKAWKV